MARFSLISLNLIRWEGALSRYRNCIERLVGRLRPHDGWHLQILGFLLLEKIKLWRQEKVGVGMANLPASGQGGAKGREGGEEGILPGHLEKELPARWLSRIYPSITETEVVIFLLGKNLENRENRGCPLLEGRAQNQPWSDFQVEYWGKLFGPFGSFPVILNFLGLLHSSFIFWAFSSQPFFGPFPVPLYFWGPFPVTLHFWSPFPVILYFLGLFQSPFIFLGPFPVTLLSDETLENGSS